MASPEAGGPVPPQPPDAAQVARGLLDAQARAVALFDEVVAAGLIRPGKLESELSREVHDLARARYGLRRHWHRRIARAGPNTLMTYYDDCPDHPIAADDIVYLDFGPVFGEWEADYGRSFVVGADPRRARLVQDIGAAFARGRALFLEEPALTAGELYDFVVGLAREAGWEFGAPTAGHLVGHFPHERPPGSKRFTIRSGNPQALREPDARGLPRHWILEIHFVDRERGYGAFCEELLTLP